MKIKKNGQVIRLTESELKRIVKRTLNEGTILTDSIQNEVEVAGMSLEGKYKIIKNGNKVRLFLNGTEVNLVDTVKQMK